MTKGEGKMRCRCDKTPVIKALADDTRLKIVEILSGGELCACDILEKLDITQPTLSYHMKILSESGVVAARRTGAWMIYSLNKDCIRSLIGFLNAFLEAKERQETNSKCRC